MRHAPPDDARDLPAAGSSGWGARLARATRVLHRLLGAPDYDAYLAHHHAHHPDDSPLSRAEFTRERMRARYERPGSRCC